MEHTRRGLDNLGVIDPTAEVFNFDVVDHACFEAAHEPQARVIAYLVAPAVVDPAQFALRVRHAQFKDSIICDEVATPDA
eukprot:CAMPEP_0185592230 /NCGR_PEP_ID=MMETSP0434-20130131/67246_1 /TAXON_ID=626734 ORGANISM="Favella taraikaensis, Strain Fe Narragansett Bay" /NCGR_SAMPLE_ID=MMETSP0434 /ASSEMBLY_ACC=CAM_ASM_000379 /LENGTH=79 /DNA_ID=CAMNT_0028217879 /DNA_START=6 /DNA_END=245 /DNA_ORIENTATION=+